MLSWPSAFQQQGCRCAPPALLPMCWSVPDNPVLHDIAPAHIYRLSMDSLDNLQPTESEGFLFINAADVFISIYPTHFRKEQELQFGPNLSYLLDSSALTPCRTVSSTTASDTNRSTQDLSGVEDALCKTKWSFLKSLSVSFCTRGLIMPYLVDIWDSNPPSIEFDHVTSGSRFG